MLVWVASMVGCDVKVAVLEFEIAVAGGTGVFASARVETGAHEASVIENAKTENEILPFILGFG